MKCISQSTYYCLFFLILIISAIAVEISDESTTELVKLKESDPAENARQLKGFNQEGWRVVESFQMGESGWIPHDQTGAQPMKRRRLRKRKRRPQIPIEEDPEQVESKRIRPQSLDQIPDDHFGEMADEAARKPSNRRRLNPIYQPPDQEQEDLKSISATIHFGSENADDNSDIIVGTVTERVVEIGGEKTEKPDIKSLLKQSGGTLSLSEILQQKNISLAELLMGSEKAISALTEKPLLPTQATVKIKEEDPKENLNIKPTVTNYKFKDLDFTVESFSSKEKVQSDQENQNIYDEIQRPQIASKVFEKTESSIEDLISGDDEVKAKDEKSDNKSKQKDTEDQKNESTPTLEFKLQPELKTESKYKRFPSRKNINRNFEQTADSVETLTSKELMEAQRRRLAILNAHKENKIYKEVTKFEVVTEPTTEKRIFVPSHPKLYTAMDFVPDLTDLTTEAIKKDIVNNQKPRLKLKLPTTNAKLNKKKEDTEEVKLPPKAVKITLGEIYGLNQSKEEIEKDGPLKMSIDIDELVKSSEHSQFGAKLPETTIPPLEKAKYATAKEEIMEILKDPISRERLAKILQIRNMTVEELVEQRERGSSQLHLADIFHNKTREPEPKEEPFVGTIKTDSLDSYSLFGRQQKSRILNTDASTEKSEEEKPVTVTSYPTYKFEMDKSKDSNPPFLWKELYPHIFEKLHEDYNKMPPKIVTESFLDDDLQSLNLNAKDQIDEDEIFINLPSGVKSAIFASLAIVGMSLVVFMTILVIFRWTQKRKTRLNYCSSFASRFSSPILQPDQRRSIKTFVCETLGRRKNYYKSDRQSMSDNIWEESKKCSF